jgi:DNA-binding transcriptional regulator YiaG
LKESIKFTDVYVAEFGISNVRLSAIQLQIANLMYWNALQSIMNSQQCRAARGLLQWSQRRLAKLSGVGLSTVAEFEIDKREPRDDNLTTIRRTFEDAGVEFIAARNGKGVGVRLREDQKQ